MTRKTPPPPSASGKTFLLVYLLHGHEDWKENRASGNKVLKLCSPFPTSTLAALPPASQTARDQVAQTSATPAIRLPRLTHSTWGEVTLHALHL